MSLRVVKINSSAHLPYSLIFYKLLHVFPIDITCIRLIMNLIEDCKVNLIEVS